jgi:competence protein ComEA
MVRVLLSAIAVAGLLCATPQAQASQARKTGAIAKPGAPGAIVNLNTATAAELESLPGIGAKTAARIIDYRQKKGTFKKIEELMNVQGIGEKSFLRLRTQITVAAKPDAGTQ